MTSARSLLAGAEVVLDRTVVLDGVKLVHPATETVPLYQGGMGPKMVRLAGEVADGMIVPLLAQPDYIRWVRQELALGAARAERTHRHDLVVFVFLSVDADARRARDGVRELTAFYLHEISKVTALPSEYGLTGEMRELAQQGVAALARLLEKRWPEDLVAVGDPDHCVAQIRRYFEAGADSVVLYPMPPDHAEEVIRIVAAEIMPQLALDQPEDLHDQKGRLV
jgi:5,10-methylenetetrahydromethanopterin reductase